MAWANFLEKIVLVAMASVQQHDQISILRTYKNSNKYVKRSRPVGDLRFGFTPPVACNVGVRRYANDSGCYTAPLPTRSAKMCSQYKRWCLISEHFLDGVFNALTRVRFFPINEPPAFSPLRSWPGRASVDSRWAECQEGTGDKGMIIWSPMTLASSVQKSHLHGLVHDLANLLCVGLRQAAAKHGEILAEHEHWSTVDLSSSSHLSAGRQGWN